MLPPAGDLIWLFGGNQCRLRWILRESGADDIIRESLSVGTVVAGWSAGAVVAGPTLPIETPDVTRHDIAGFAPFFIVRDVARSLTFYRDQLGFEITFEGFGDELFFGIVSRGGAMITDDGLRGFELRDPDGHVLFFGRPRS